MATAASPPHRAPSTAELSAPPRVPWRPVLIFVVLANALAWLVSAPLWRDPRHLAAPYAVAVLTSMMVVPALAALLTARFVERVPLGDALALRPSKPTMRFVLWLLIALGTVTGLVVAAMVTSALFGTYDVDLVHFSALRQVFDAQSAALGRSVTPPLPMWALALVTLPNLVLASLINTLPALGEEAGWRGWLFPRLLPLGPVPAIVLSGVIWGVWHAPVILLGYNYPNVPGWLGVACMSVMCTLVGAVLAWVRMRSASAWPAALGHGTLNAMVGALALTFGRAGSPVDTTRGTIMGWAGWLVPALVVALLVVRNGFAPAPRVPEGRP